MPRQIVSLALAALIPCNVACPGPSGGEGEGEGEGTYAFESRFLAGESSVQYGGQAARHLLLQELKEKIGATDDTAIDGKTADQLIARFAFLYDFKTENGGTPEEPITVTAFGVALEQTEIGQIGVASLRDKTRDNDLGDATGVVGWQDGGLTASQVAEDLIAELADTMVARQNAIPTTPDGVQIQEPFVSAAGVDYQQLIEKYLFGAVAFSQNCDDYLDDDTANKGILSDNVLQVADKPYTELEHAWDEGFGYFGAARAYGTVDAAGNIDGILDDDGDDAVDWLTEVNYGHARTAAQRDAASVTGTTFGRDAFDAYVAGRSLITQTSGSLNDGQLDALRGFRQTAEQNWERAIAATAIRSVNGILVELNADPNAYSFRTHTKLWSELKGVLLAIQFNPRSPFVARSAGADFQRAHVLIGGDAPVISRADFGAEIVRFEELKALIQSVYGFDDDDVAVW